MFLHEMTVPERLESIVRIARRLARAPAHAAFVTERPDLVVGCRGKPVKARGTYIVLEVTAPEGRSSPDGSPNMWKLGFDGERKHAEDVLTYTMLLSLAHDANVCPRCHACLTRRKGPGLQRYSCGCGMQVVERT